MICRKCKGDMNTGIATAQTYVGGMPDFSDDKHAIMLLVGLWLIGKALDQ